jgi:hypothetical protein
MENFQNPEINPVPDKKGISSWFGLAIIAVVAIIIGGGIFA